jgi:5-methylcytosine-specific restriction endonuclease McrA
MLNREVLVLNQNYEPLSITKARRAVILLYLGKAEMVERYDGHFVRGIRVSIPLPSVVRLIYYIKAPRNAVALTRKNIIRRDRHTCQYCGIQTGPMTTDHVIPKRIGGRDSWENLVCACVRCNNKKGDRIPEEAGMALFRRPKAPHFFTVVHSFIKIPDRRWKQYLFLE